MKSTVTISLTERYAPSSRAFHWLTSVLVAVVIFFGVWIKYFEPAEQAFKLRLYNIHESFGVVVFLIVVLRLLNRWRRPPPPLPADTPGVIRAAAHTSHALLYVLLLLMPVVGFLATNAWGFPLTVFGVVPLPAPYGKDEELAKLLSFLHWCGAITLILLIGAHLMGVVYHTFIRRDGLLRRML